MAAVGDKQNLVWFPTARATALNLSCTAYWKAKFTPRLEARLVKGAEYLAKKLELAQSALRSYAF